MLTNDQPITTGAIESPLDYRNGFATAAVPVPAAPSEVFAFSYVGISKLPVLMQALIPACVAHQIATMLTDFFYKKTGNVIHFSARFIDVLMKQYDGQPIDGGASMYLGLKLVARFGCATTATVPNDTSLPLIAYRDKSVLTQSAYAEALSYKIPGYIRVPVDPKSLRDYIYHFGIVSTLRNIGKEWYTPSWLDSAIDPLKTPVVVVSGHQTCDYGWNGQYNLLRNCWSTAWANGGNAKYDLSAWLPFIREAWVIAEIPNDIKTFLASLPSPSNFHYNWAVDMSYSQGVSDDVKYLQIALMILGFLIPPPVDQLGLYGPMTAAAVLAYQQANGVPTMGLGGHRVGPLTRASLNARFAL